MKKQAIKMNKTPRKSLNDFSNKEMQQLQTNSLLKINKAIRRNNALMTILVAFLSFLSVVWAITIIIQ